MVIDGRVTLFSSMNWSGDAARNSENLNLVASRRCEEAIPEFGGGAIATPRTAPKRVTGWLAGSTLTSPVPGSGKPSRCSVHQAIGPVPQCNFSDRKIVARSPEVYPQAGGAKIVTVFQRVLIRETGQVAKSGARVVARRVPMGWAGLGSHRAGISREWRLPQPVRGNGGFGARD